MWDVEQQVYQAIKSLGGITCWQVEATTPWPHRLEAAQIQVDVRASSKKRARDRAYEALAILLALPDLDWSASDGVIVAADPVAGPAWQPDEDGAPRYVLRMMFYNHRQSVGVG